MSASAPAAFRVDAGAADTLALSGALVFATAGEALAEAGAALARGRQTRLDLAGVTGADSAGLACVLALMADAHGRGRDLRVLNLPVGMRALAVVSEVDGLLAG
jgi:phospholipid transport system transporter-binding protein